MEVTIQVTLGIFIFYKCEISSNGSHCTFLAFLICARAANRVWWKKSLLYYFSATDMENHLIFLLGQDILAFCWDLQTLCVCLDSQEGESMSRCSKHPGTPAPVFYNLPQKYARLVGGVNGMPFAPASKFSCRWGIKMEMVNLHFNFEPLSHRH